MLYILLIVLAFIIDSPWPVVAGIVLFLIATLTPDTPRYGGTTYKRRKR